MQSDTAPEPYRCDRCQQTIEWQVIAAAAPPALPRPMWSRGECLCESAELIGRAKPDQDAVAKANAILRSRVWRESGITEAMKSRWTFANFDFDLSLSMGDACEALMAIAGGDTEARTEYGSPADVPKPPRGVLLEGPVGCGKTHLLVATASALASAGVSVRYTSLVDLLSEIRDGYHDRERGGQGMALALKARWLALDDLGAERIAQDSRGDWTREQMFRLLDARYRAGLPLLAATNLSEAELAEHIGGGVAGERIVSRIHAAARWTAVTGPDVRRLR